MLANQLFDALAVGGRRLRLTDGAHGRQQGVADVFRRFGDAVEAQIDGFADAALAREEISQRQALARISLGRFTQRLLRGILELLGAGRILAFESQPLQQVGFPRCAGKRCLIFASIW